MYGLSNAGPIEIQMIWEKYDPKRVRAKPLPEMRICHCGSGITSELEAKRCRSRGGFKAATHQHRSSKPEEELLEA